MLILLAYYRFILVQRAAIDLTRLLYSKAILQYLHLPFQRAKDASIRILLGILGEVEEPMNGPEILKYVQELLRDSPIEIRDNIVYNIIHNDQDQKAALKLLINQGNPSEYHTVITIDFLSKERFPDHTRTALDYPAQNGMPRIRIYNSSIFIYGEYQKMSREMTQTPLKIKGELKTERSVSDFITEFEKFYGSAPGNFIGCGREDIDVCCIEGRPFLLELPAPRVNLKGSSISIRLHPDIDLKNVWVVSREYKKEISSDVSSKTYTMDIFSVEPLQFQKIYCLQQKTPLRVLHRRANMVRERTIEILEAKNAIESLKDDSNSGYYYELEVKADSGTYIKEWVTSDFGRTVPSLKSDILRLDVLRVDKPFNTKLVLWKLILKKYKI